MSYYYNHTCKYSFSCPPDKLAEIQRIVKKYDIRFVGNPNIFKGNNYWG